MKQLIKAFSLRSFFTLVMLTIIQTAVWAQDNTGGGSSGGGTSGGTSGGGTSTSTTSTSITKSETWYTEPWVWIVAGAVLLLLIVALTRGGGSDRAGRSDKVTVTKSVRTDTDV